jgi:hypothetical protein
MIHVHMSPLWPGQPVGAAWGEQRGAGRTVSGSYSANPATGYFSEEAADQISVMLMGCESPMPSCRRFEVRACRLHLHEDQQGFNARKVLTKVLTFFCTFGSFAAFRRPEISTYPLE